jgi:hypothetical protein
MPSDFKTQCFGCGRYQVNREDFVSPELCTDGVVSGREDGILWAFRKDNVGKGFGETRDSLASHGLCPFCFRIKLLEYVDQIAEKEVVGMDDKILPRQSEESVQAWAERFAKEKGGENAFVSHTDTMDSIKDIMKVASFIIKCKPCVSIGGRIHVASPSATQKGSGIVGREVNQKEDIIGRISSLLEKFNPRFKGFRSLDAIHDFSVEYLLTCLKDLIEYARNGDYRLFARLAKKFTVRPEFNASDTCPECSGKLDEFGNCVSGSHS